MRMAIVALGMLVFVGCGSDEKTPVDKCEDFLDNICTRGAECVPENGSKSDCVAAITAFLPCDNVMEVTEGYDSCMDQIDDSTCAVLFPVDGSGEKALDLPTQCSGVLLTSGSKGEIFELRSSGFSDVATARSSTGL